MSGYDVHRGIEARDTAIEAAEKAAAETWKRAALEAVEDAARLKPEFTTDAVWFLLDQRRLPRPREPRALGAIMLKAVARGICEAIEGRVHRSVRVECHRRPISVYRSKIYAPK